MPKIYLPLGSKTVLEHALSLFLASVQIDQVVLVLDREDRLFSTLSIAHHPKILRASGGAERLDSVLAGLEALSDRANHDDWVLVHDAARPYLCETDLARLLQITEQENPSAAVLAAPVYDTIKSIYPCEKDGPIFIEKTENRDRFARVFTPQLCPYGLLKDSLKKVQKQGMSVTDEMQAIELHGFPTQIIWGDPNNIKLTTMADYILLKNIFSSQEID